MMQSDHETPAVHDIGVLFVHGIGQQRRGDTLIQWTDMIFEWLLRWLAGSKSEHANNLHPELSDVVLRPEQNGRNEPAHATVRIVDEQEQIASWLVVESYWAESFYEPAYRKLLGWAFRQLPRMMIFHFANAVRTADQDAVSLGGSAAQYELGQAGFRAWIGIPVAALLTPAALLILFVMPVLAWLPFGWAKSAAEKVKELVSGVLGDSLLFVDSEIARMSILTKVTADLAWLQRQKCKRIAVIGHSQGAAIVYQALRLMHRKGTLDSKTSLAITFGSGLRKLLDMRPVKAERFFDTPLFANFAAWCTVALTYVLVCMLVLFSTELSTTASVVVVITSLLVVFALLVIVIFFAVVPLQSEVNSVPVRGWVDLYATSDPVPSGPLMSQYEMRQYNATKHGRKFAMGKVANRGSVLGDHTSYWESTDDFISRVVLALLLESRFPIGKYVDDALSEQKRLLETVPQRRRWRMHLRRGFRTLSILAFAGMVITQSNTLGLLGTEMARRLDEWQILHTLRIDWVGSVVPSQFLGSIALGIVIYVVHRFGLGGFNRWEAKEISDFFERRLFQLNGSGISQFAVGALLMVVGPTILSSLNDMDLILVASAHALFLAGVCLFTVWRWRRWRLS